MMIGAAQKKRLLLVAHAPSPNTLALSQAVAQGVGQIDIDIVVKPPLSAGPEDVLNAQAIILGTPENLGYMSGALKDFFDRIYTPCLERTQGLPYALYVRAGQSAGAGSCRAVEGIVTGLRWKAIQPPLVLSGAFHPDFIGRCLELGQTMAAGLEMGIF